MKYNVINKSITIAFICLSSYFLSGCSDQPKNPLLSEENIRSLKAKIMISMAFLDRRVGICSPYLANPESHADLKADCDEWAADRYKILLQKGDLPHKTTLAEFKDPELWKILTQ